MLTSRSRGLFAASAAASLLLAGCGTAGESATPGAGAAAPSTGSAASAPASPSWSPSSATATSAPAVPDTERWHPVAHLAPKSGVAGAPGGLVHQDGTYHAFYRHQASVDAVDPADGGPSDWAHATSTDLVHWKDQPVALPAGDDDVLTGSIAVDTAGDSGLGDGSTAPWVAVYSTTAGSETSIRTAYSTDSGTTWQRNGTVDGTWGLQDPKVFRYEAGDYWVMTAANPDGHRVQLYRSYDLQSWEPISTFGNAGTQAGSWHSPDLFPLPLDGNADDVKWVMLVSTTQGAVAGGSGVQYFVGSFDGTSFEAEHTGPAGVGAVQPTENFSWLDWGPDLFAATTYNDAPDGRRIALGALGNQAYAASTPTGAWRGTMSLPRELTLETVGGIPRLTQQLPVETASALDAKGPAVTEDSVVTSGNRKLDSEANGTSLTVQATLVPGDAAAVGVTVLGSTTGQRGTRISYFTESGVLQVDRSTAGKADFTDTFSANSAAPVSLVDGKLPVRIVADGSTVEVFAGDVVLSTLVFPAQGDDAVSVFGSGKATVEDISVTPIG
ncbi:glycoside hydrolase family 32 protein [Nakamurella sp. GG22]